jgi:hypothetical protein
MKLRPLGTLLFCALLAAGLGSKADADPFYQASADFTKYAMKLRESAILNMEPHVFIPTAMNAYSVSGKYPWKSGIVTTVFWIGEPAGGNNPVHNFSSSWDLNWESSYGGYDNPNPGSRRNFIPVAFTPRQNPFYIALPYNDVTHGTTKAEARIVIPWFKEAFVQEGQTVCRDRWIAIRNSAGKVCYAQWEDCGPFRTDHWQYVFGNEKPRPNLNGGAGLDVSPAVRDYLELSSTDVTDWKFVDVGDVPSGPWALYGENNSVARNVNRQPRLTSLNQPRSYSAPAPTSAPEPTPTPAPPKKADAPTIITTLPQ